VVSAAQKRGMLQESQGDSTGMVFRFSGNSSKGGQGLSGAPGRSLKVTPKNLNMPLDAASLMKSDRKESSISPHNVNNSFNNS
jgi:hypothetical protein